jgi:predicted ATPase
VRVELIGRDNEIDLLASRLTERRLVTVIGPAGIGKTALAREVVGRVAGSFAMGSRVVDLTRVDSVDAVGEAMAAQLGFPSFEALILSPADQPVLLLVDNCEHVTEAAAAAITELLAACLAPTVLATSRSPLDVAGETVVVIGPLELPAAGFADPRVAAVRLFLDRAHHAGAAVPDGELEVIGELCRRLDGLPLALEIAAARTRSMTPTEIVAHLDERLDVLSRPRFKGAARHRSLRTAIEWSYGMLDPADAVVFDRLGVFAGPFTAAMAHAVAAEAGTAPIQTLEHLDALVAASLVVADRDGPTTRFRVLETLRVYAVEQLTARGELTVIWERFVDHVVSVTTTIFEQARHAWTASALSELLALYDNISAAVRWCVANDDDPDRALRLVAVLWGVVHQGHVTDVAGLGERVLERVLERWRDPGAPMWPDAVATVATCRYLLGRPGEAIELAEQALAVADPSPFAPVTLRRVIGLARRALGDTTTSLAVFAEGAAQARARDLTAMAMELDVAHAIVTGDIGDIDEALAEVRASRDEAARRHADINVAFADASEGYILLRCDPVAAIPVIEAALADARRIAYPAAISRNLRSLALGHVATGRLHDAAQAVLDLLDDLAQRGDLTELRVTLDTAAVVLERAHRPVWADLAATAASLPVVSVTASVGYELFPVPADQGRCLPAREAIITARGELRELVDRVAPPPAIEPAPVAGAVFQRVGEFWELQFAGRSAHLNPTKGMTDLARLLAEPGKEIHCLDLIGAGVDQASTGEMIDQTARRQYEQRIRDLQTEIDEADNDNDHGRADRARVEYDTIVDHLTAALGLAGSTRRSGGSAERARSAVTQRLRSTIRRIADAHPPLGRHLDASINTGTYCSYQPEHPVPWTT